MEFVMIVGLLLGAILVAQVLLAAGYILKLRNFRSEPLEDTACPKAAVIMCIRGVDPSLVKCIRSVLDQDYPCYDLRFVLDSKDDPAWPVVEEIIEDIHDPPARIKLLANPLKSCSLKCSSLIQAIAELDESYEIVALLDSDVVPHRLWLRDLLAAFRDARVGATTGIRWFIPDQINWGSLTRHVWNTHAVVLMYWLDVAWGGSLAIRTAVIREARLLERWRHTFVEDTPLSKFLHRLGLKLELVPAVTMIDQQSCSVGDFLRWSNRQLLYCRLHHSGWRVILIYGLASNGLLIAMLGLVVFGLLAEQPEVSQLAGSMLVGYLLIMTLLLVALELRVRDILVAQGKVIARNNNLGATYVLVPSIVLAQLLFGPGLLRTAMARCVEWRGIRYRIHSGNHVEMLEYKSYETLNGGS